MATRYQARKSIIDWIRLNTVYVNDLSEFNTAYVDESSNLVNFSPKIRDTLKSMAESKWLSYDEETDIVKICDLALTHTSSSKRVSAIDELEAGTKLDLKVDGGEIIAIDSLGREIGDCSNISDVFAEALENGDIKVVSVVANKITEKGTKKPLVNVTIDIKLLPVDHSDAKCIFALTEGDQVQGWAQRIEVIYSNMPVDDAKLLFEIYNRRNDEYLGGNDDTSYAGLDNLADEITEARKKMRSEMKAGDNYSEFECDDNDFAQILSKAIKENSDKYGNLLKYTGYINPDNIRYVDFTDIYEKTILDKETYYWIDQVRCSFEEYEGLSFNHFYSVAELFEGNTLPIDFKDEDVISTFGTKKFIAFADLSYGC